MGITSAGMQLLELASLIVRKSPMLQMSGSILIKISALALLDFYGTRHCYNASALHTWLQQGLSVFVIVTTYSMLKDFVFQTAHSFPMQ